MCCFALRQNYSQFIQMRTFTASRPTLPLGPGRPHNKTTYLQTTSPKHNQGTTRPHLSTKSPKSSLIKIITDDMQEKKELRRENSFNILHYLDKKQPEVLHQYRKFENHSKASELNQVRDIILELLNKHAIERKLSSSEQYILTGYFAKYIEYANTAHRLINNPFNIEKRLLSNNSPDMVTQPYIENPSPRRTLSRNKTANKFKNKSNAEQMRDQLKKELEMVKFLWQMYMLKSLTCPNLTKLSPEEETSNRRDLLDIVNRLKTIQQKRNKLGEEKALSELGKVMRRFQTRIQTCLL